jgi:haloalkane dehalogenase
VKEAYLLPYKRAVDRLAQLRFVQDIPLVSTDRSYAAVSQVQSSLDAFRKKPVLILWGEKDFVFDHHFLEAWQQKLPQAEVHRFPQAGHLVLEDAGDEIVPIVKQFLKKHPLKT